MTTNRQGDLFATACGAIPSRDAGKPNADAIRERLLRTLAVVRQASTMPWEAPRARAQKHLFANMAEWLPHDERDTLKRAFLREMNRLRSVGGRS